MADKHAPNYTHQNCLFCIVNFFYTSSTAIDTPKYKISHLYVGICGWW